MSASWVAYGFSWRKRALLRRFVQRADIKFVRRGSQVPSDATLLLWGACELPAGVPPGVKVVRLEDGFLMSVLTAICSGLIARHLRIGGALPS